MKKQILQQWKIALMMLAFLEGMVLFASCNKQDQDLGYSDKNEIEKRGALKNCDSSCLEHLKMKVINNTLEFPNVVDYEKAISCLASLDEKTLLLWPASVGFISMRCTYGDKSLNENGFEDEVLTTLLNPDGVIVIEDYYYLVAKGKVYVTSKDDVITNKSFINAASKVFDVDEDVIAIMKGEALKEDVLKGCDSNNSGWKYFYLSGGSVQYRARYYKAGIYFSLRALMEKSGTGIEMHMGSVINPNQPKSFARRATSDNWCSFLSGNTGGLSNSYSIYFYSSMKSLSAYQLCVWYSAYDLHQNGVVHDGIIRIKCNEWNVCPE